MNPKDLETMIGKIVAKQFDSIVRQRANNIRDGIIREIDTSTNTCTVQLLGSSEIIRDVKYLGTSDTSIGEVGLVISADPTLSSRVRFISFKKIEASTTTTTTGGGGVSTPSYVRAYLSGGDQSITANTITVVDLNTEVFDVNGDFNITTFTYTAPVDCIVIAIGGIQFGVAVDNDTLVGWIFLNAGQEIQNQQTAESTNNWNIFVAGLVECAAGDEITLRARNNNSNDLLRDGRNLTTMSIGILHEL